MKKRFQLAVIPGIWEHCQYAFSLDVLSRPNSPRDTASGSSEEKEGMHKEGGGGVLYTLGLAEGKFECIGGGRN